MKKETLEKANQLNKKIESLRELVKDTQNQKCEWIVFTYGNGSSKSTVCKNEDTIQSVRELLLEENRKDLENIEEELEDL